MKLINKTKNSEILGQLKIARSFMTRAVGLIGTKHLDPDEGMWFPKSNWIHTSFMSIPIDTVYVDKNMKVRKLQPNLQPWRYPAPVFGASSVFEMKAGTIKNKQIELGDILYVGD